MSERLVKSTNTEVVALESLNLSVLRREPHADRGAPKKGILLLHGWPGTGLDWAGVFARLASDEAFADVTLLCPDLRGYGHSDWPSTDATADQPYSPYAPAAHVADMTSLLVHYGLDRVVLGAYDLGANIAQALARVIPSSIAGLVLCDPVHPAARAQAARLDLSSELWYQTLHALPWATDLIAHDRQTTEIYLRHFYTHWWGGGTVDENHFQAIVDLYSRRGAFEAGIGWYRARAGSRKAEAARAAATEALATPTEVLWGLEDPVTPSLFADSLDQSFSDFQLTRLTGVGHFAPLEAPSDVHRAFSRLQERGVWRTQLRASRMA